MPGLPLLDLSATATAFALGLAGLVHCVGMCGGIAATLTLGLHPRLRQAKPRLIAFLLLYNLGRLSSYGLAGAAVGAAGAGVEAVAVGVVFPVGHLATAVFMLLAGLHVTGWWNGLAFVERGGGLVWGRWVQPFTRRLLPVGSPVAAFAAGCLWGWMPCGLVYAALVLAAMQADAWRGAAVMLCFGLGTLPALLGSGFFADRVFTLMRASRLRVVLGALVMALGVFALFRLSAAVHASHSALEALPELH